MYVEIYMYTFKQPYMCSYITYTTYMYIYIRHYIYHICAPIHICETLYRLSRVYLYVTAIHENRGHKFAQDQGLMYGRVWRENNEGENDVII